MALYQVTSDTFCAGVEVAPVLKYWLITSAVKRGWKIKEVEEKEVMAYRKKQGGDRPSHYIAVQAVVGKGKYEKGPYIGLWEGDGKDNSPLFRGSVSGKYLDELYDFIKEYGQDNIGFAIFRSRDDKGRGREDDRDNDRDRNRDDDRRPSRASRDDDREPAGRGRPRRESRDDDKREPETRGRGRSTEKENWWND